jgi:hypothetical protein
MSQAQSRGDVSRYQSSNRTEFLMSISARPDLFVVVPIVLQPIHIDANVFQMLSSVLPDRPIRDDTPDGQSDLIEPNAHPYHS